MTVSALILTLDEAANIEACIQSLPWRDDVHVLDSCSSDGTKALAKKMGAKVTERRFTDYADQRNAGLNLPFAHEWIIMLDADERVTPELAAEIERVLQQRDRDVAMGIVRRKDMFLGRWLRRSSGYPSYFPRLMRKGAVRVTRPINEEYQTDGQTIQLQEHLLHYPFNKGIDWWFERHNRYSRGEANILMEESQERAIQFADLVSGNPLRRRACLKQLVYRLPGRPFLMFAYLYFVRLGFLDGRAGFLYAQMRLAYEIMIDTKQATLRADALDNRL